MGTDYRIRVVSISAFALLGIVWALNYSRPVARHLAQVPARTQEKIRAALVEPLEKGDFPQVLEFGEDGQSYLVPVQYTLDLEMQRYMERKIRRWKPDYCAFVALDAETGRVLTMVSYSRRTNGLGNLALRATFPAASVFKVVTATAAIDRGEVTPDTVIAFNGADHTLYRRNVTSTKYNRWTRYIPVKRAFARSINTVFGKLGIQHLDPGSLQSYAKRFLFNQGIPGDLPVQDGAFVLKGEDDFSVAELASGYNRVIRISPLQGALIAAAVANDGVVMVPHVVDSLRNWDGELARGPGGEPLFLAPSQKAKKVMGGSTAGDMRLLMQETVSRGTARSAFAGIFRRKNFNAFEIGGKTGTLKGDDPPGSNDWFVGYALSDNRRIALAALTVNIDRWQVKSATLARRFIQQYFRNAE